MTNVEALIERLELTAKLHANCFFSFDCAEAAAALRLAYRLPQDVTRASDATHASDATRPSARVGVNKPFTSPPAAGKITSRRK